MVLVLVNVLSTIDCQDKDLLVFSLTKHYYIIRNYLYNVVTSLNFYYGFSNGFRYFRLSQIYLNYYSFIRYITFECFTNFSFL